MCIMGSTVNMKTAARFIFRLDPQQKWCRSAGMSTLVPTLFHPYWSSGAGLVKGTFMCTRGNALQCQNHGSMPPHLCMLRPDRQRKSAAGDCSITFVSPARAALLTQLGWLFQLLLFRGLLADHEAG